MGYSSSIVFYFTIEYYVRLGVGVNNIGKSRSRTREKAGKRTTNSVVLRREHSGIIRIRLLRTYLQCWST